jgi:beta-glucanase (GH16 family)
MLFTSILVGRGTARPMTSDPAAPAGRSSPQGIPGDWTLTFDDEFNGHSVDLTKWRPNWLASSDTAITKPVNVHELSCYDPSLVTESDGFLTISAVERPCTANNGVTYPYASGIVESYGHYQFTYGVMEARIWLPPGAGAAQNWPGFWANGTGRWPTTGEIDVMEALHGNVCWHFHYTGGAPGGCAAGMVGGWHVFAADWQPGRIDFYYDGVLAGSVDSGITSAPMYLIVNLGLSSSISGPVVAPSRMKVAYVRVWQ